MSARPTLTVGMACYDDFEGVWFTVTALRLYHAEVLPHVEILVVDNHPESPDGRCVRSFLENWVAGARYIPFPTPTGTAAPRNEVFAQARGEAVLCLDSHVLLAPGALRRLIAFYADHPECRDLLQGPLVYDDLRTYSTHFADEWRAEMWGVWASDPRAESPPPPYSGVGAATAAQITAISAWEQSPFEIPAQGLGLFSCRKQAWLGFHPDFRGFGGEEFYIHEKYRQAGRRTLCLPFLRWVHRFTRSRGVPYPLTVDHKFRNYILGLRELGLPLDPAIEHFANCLPDAAMARILADPQRLPESPNPSPPAVVRRHPWWHAWRRAVSQVIGRNRPGRHRAAVPPRGPVAASSSRAAPAPALAAADANQLSSARGRSGKPALRLPIPCGHDAYPAVGREPAQLGWYEWIARRHAGARFIDVGAGTGAGLAYLAYFGAAAARGFEVDERLGHLPHMTIGRSPIESFGAGACEVAVCLDVIEHVVDDVPLVNELLQLATQAVYISSPNFARSQARNHHHAREYTIGEFAAAFRPDEVWVASPDGWYHRTKLLEARDQRYRHCLTGESWPVAEIPAQYPFQEGSPDGLEWAHFCGVFHPPSNPALSRT